MGEEHGRIANRSIPKTASVIGSHFVYKIMVEKELNIGVPTEKFNLKSRLCVRGNKDNERESLRTDAAAVQHIGFRLLYSLACEQGTLLGKADVRGSDTQSGQAQREIFVKPPFRSKDVKVLWLLKATSYGIVFAGRKWQRRCNAIVMNNLGLSLVIEIRQLFIYKKTDGIVVALLAKYVDGLIIAARTEQGLKSIPKKLEETLEIGSWNQWPSSMYVNSTEVVQ